MCPRALSPVSPRWLPTLRPPTRLCLLTLSLLQPDSYRAPFAVGANLDIPEQYLAQCSQGLSSGPQTVQAAKAAHTPSMSGYGKNQQYVYGK